MNQHVTDVAKVERIDPETGEITEVSTASEITAPAAKRKLPLQPILEEKVPPLPTPAADRIDANWDIAHVATKGHVHLERIFAISEKVFWPSILLAMLSFLLIVRSFPGASFGPYANLMFWGALGLVVLVALFMANGQSLLSEDPWTFVAGPAVIGFGLWLFAAYAERYPNGWAAWIGFGLKIAIVIGLILWCGKHILKSAKSSESRAVLWVAAAYVGFVVVGTVILGSLAGAMSGSGPGGMSAIASMLTYDRDTYFDLGGGLRSGPEYRWLGEHAPNGGLSVTKLNALIKAVQTDLANHGNDAASWEEVTKLNPAPMITRPEKAIRDNSKELPNGIVVIPEGRDPVTIVAHVEGQWSISVIAPRDCAAFLGPFDAASGCQNATTPSRPINQYAAKVLNTLKPTAAVAETKE
ncbi:hypothetical protein V6R85_23895 [Agrobacterium sp. CCNWLW32]|uniref:hypothetical protein n=1 Tax=Agrobacterium sp. CCNWLW32 TaxID=3122072 RepID=UPI00300F8CC2